VVDEVEVEEFMFHQQLQQTLDQHQLEQQVQVQTTIITITVVVE
jgi:hypothetical protein